MTSPRDRVRAMKDREADALRDRRRRDREVLEMLERYPGRDVWERFRAFMDDLRGGDR